MCIAGPGSARMWTPPHRGAAPSPEQQRTSVAISLPMAAGAASRGEKPRGTRPQPQPCSQAGAGCWGDLNRPFQLDIDSGISNWWGWCCSGRDSGGTWERDPVGTCERTFKRVQERPQGPPQPYPGLCTIQWGLLCWPACSSSWRAPFFPSTDQGSHVI